MRGKNSFLKERSPKKKASFEETCTCGHSQDDHGGDQEYPGSTACNDDDCDCVAYERADNSFV